MKILLNLMQIFILEALVNQKMIKILKKLKIFLKLITILNNIWKYVLN